MYGKGSGPEDPPDRASAMFTAHPHRHAPNDSHNSGTIQRFQNVAKKLKRIQKQAAEKAISGGYMLVAGKAYNIELDLLPIDLYIKLAAIRAALKLFTTPTIRGSKRASVLPWGKLSTKIEQQIGASINNLEIWKPYLCAPWESLALSFIVQQDIHAVIEHEKLLADIPALNIFTDGSDIDENIGAEAVNLDTGGYDSSTGAGHRPQRRLSQSASTNFCR